MNEICLSLAIQKSGRLSDASKNLLRECDIHFENGSSQLKSRAGNFPLELLFIRDDDIARCVADGVIDAGIVGENLLSESEIPVNVVEKLGFGRCRLSIAVPRSSGYKSIEELAGRRIATSYPNTLSRFLNDHGVSARIVTFQGSVEVAPSLGLADAICDLVSTGSTLMANGLSEISTLASSQAVLVTNSGLSGEKQNVLDRLLFRIRAVRSAEQKRYVMLNAPLSAVAKISEALPAANSPTIIPLAREGWCAVHTVVREEQLWSVVEKTKALGGEGIFIVRVEGEVP